MPITRPEANANANATVVRTTVLNQGRSPMAARLVSREPLHDCCEPILNTYACGGHDGPIDAAYILVAKGERRAAARAAGQIAFSPACRAHVFIKAPSRSLR